MAQRHYIRQLFVATLALSLVTGCDDLGNGDDGGTGGDGPIITPDSGPPPQGITFKQGGETAEADFATGSEEFLVVPYSTSETASTAINYDIKVTGASPGSEANKAFKLQLPPRLPLSVRNPLLWQRWQQRLSVERWSRGLMVQAAKLKLSGPSRPMDKKLASCTSSADCGATEVCDNTGNCASTLKIKVGEFASTATEIDVEVKKKGTMAAILVDKADTVAQSAIDGMLDKFEQVIYPCNKKLFGDPILKTGGTTLASDRNADGLIWIVLTSKVQDKTAVGFFVATDFVDVATNAKSNEADILYVDSAQTGDKAYTTIAHELQHLLGFAVKKYKPEQNGGSGALEALWLDEGQSHFAEDACGWGGENVTLLDQEVFPNFSDTATFETATDGLAMRGMAMLFIRYLYEQKGGESGGEAFLNKLHEESKQGTEAIGAVYGDVKAAFANWVVAVALDGRSGTGITDARYSYAALTTHAVTGNMVGVKIRGKRKDETGADVDLEGPLDEDLTADTSDSVANATAKFFLLKGKSGKVSVSVSSQDSSIAFALIKIK